MLITGFKNDIPESLKSVKCASQFAKHVTKQAKDVLLANGEHHPCFIMLSESHEIYGQTIFTSPSSKDTFADMVKKIAKKENAIGVAFISEAWATTVMLKASEIPDFSPKEEDNRVEVLMILVEWKGGDSLATRVEIQRDGDGKICRLIELLENIKGFTGRFTSFLE